MNRKRIFIAINLPESVKKELLSFQDKWPELPARWTGENNLHITLAFLGYVSDNELLKVCDITKRVAERHKAFDIRLSKVLYGPPKKLPPRMIWAEAEKSSELATLKEDLERELAGEIRFSPENRAFSPHITLARIRAWEWRKIEPEERPEINEDIDIAFEVNSVEVMESVLKRGGAEYSVLESTPLSK